MIGHRAQRRMGRALVTAAIVAMLVVLVLIYVRSGGSGTGAGTVSLRASTSRSTAGEAGSRGTAGASTGSGGPPTTSTPQNEEAAQGTEAGGGAGTGGGNGGAPAKGATGHATGTFTGPSVQTPYGPVQVAVAEQGGRITDVKAMQLPTEHAQSLFISERASPLLREEVLQAQSAQISIVSGATYTSEGYAESLQQALSHAH
jgi:uncharacterized protein with FMN-binding domain